MSDTNIYFALWCAAIAIVFCGAAALEHFIYWLQDRYRWLNWFNWQ